MVNFCLVPLWNIYPESSVRTSAIIPEQINTITATGHVGYFSSLHEHSRIPKVDDDDDDAIAAIAVISGDDDVPEKFPKGVYSLASRKKNAVSFCTQFSTQHAISQSAMEKCFLMKITLDVGFMWSAKI